MHIHGLGDPGVYQMLQDALVAGGLVALLAGRPARNRPVYERDRL